jgi:hypothetical protein
MLASERPAFGQVWRYSTAKVVSVNTVYMLIAPDRDRLAAAGAWVCLYLGPGDAPVLWAARTAEGRSVFDSMGGLPGCDKAYLDPAWERVE